MDSPVKIFLRRLSQLPNPHKALDDIMSQLEPLERIALAREWRYWWARPEQLAPETHFRSWGMLTGRGYGKTTSISNAINERVRLGLTRRIAIMGQDEDASWNVQVEGEDGLLAWAHPSCPAWVENGHVYWQNGAQATIFTPKSPDGIFGDQFDTAWVSEIHAWSRATMMKAWVALKMCLRARAAVMFWDSNPRKKHPILLELLERGEIAPDKHIVVRGNTIDNIDNLNQEEIAEWIKKYAGTQIGREMLNGEMVDDDDGSSFRQEWIDNHRRDRPSVFKRKVIGIDPAISGRENTDDTGIHEGGLGNDGQLYALEDFTGKHKWEKWGDIVLDAYERDRCDCVVLERNRGGDACVANLRARGQTRERIENGTCLVIQVVENEAITRYVQGTVYVKEVIGRDSKGTRTKPVASLCEMGKISFVNDREFTKLEDQATSFIDEPGAVSPNNLDAFVWVMWELAGLSRKSVNTKSFAGLDQANRILTSPTRPSISALLANAGRGRTI